jgi:hypothetical protein
MLERVAGRDLPPRDTRLRCELIVRESCGQHIVATSAAWRRAPCCGRLPTSAVRVMQVRPRLPQSMINSIPAGNVLCLHCLCVRCSSNPTRKS